MNKDVKEKKEFILNGNREDKLFVAYVNKLTDEEVNFFYNMYFVYMDQQMKNYANTLKNYKERF